MSAPSERAPFAAPPLVYVVQPPGVEYRVLREEDLKDRRITRVVATARGQELVDQLLRYRNEQLMR